MEKGTGGAYGEQSRDLDLLVRRRHRRRRKCPELAALTNMPVLSSRAGAASSHGIQTGRLATRIDETKTL